MRKLCLGFSFAAMAVLAACSSDNSSNVNDLVELSSSSGSEVVDPGDGSIYDASANTLTDLRDGQVYRTTTIAPKGTDYSEVWMAENLNFETEYSWCGGGTGTTEGDCSIYGRLYTWAAAVAKSEDECGRGLRSGDIRGACPKGWHLPRNEE